MERHQLWLYIATGMFGMIVGRIVIMLVAADLTPILPNIVTFFGINSVLSLFLFKHQEDLEARDHESWIIVIMLVFMALSILLGLLGYQEIEQTTQTIRHTQV